MSIEETIKDSVTGPAGAMAKIALTLGLKAIPRHLRNDAAARIGDRNPFATIPDQHDLTRAVRVAWVEAALEMLKAATAETDGRMPSVLTLHDFAAHAETCLTAVRSATFDRRNTVGDSPIDKHIPAVLDGTLRLTADSHETTLTQHLIDGFAATLAKLTGRDEAAIHLDFAHFCPGWRAIV